MPHVKLCPSCERRNLAYNTVCEFCGTSLDQTAPFDAPELVAPKLTLNQYTLTVPLQVELVIGRSDPQNDWKPDIDLAPFGGTSGAGVSRRHARLVWYGHWQIEDLGSANGTWLNRHRLQSGEPLDLTAGSIIQIGKLYLVYHG
ncbi:MAG: FHA domain-containing protein [Chloroflexi bacterium]|nr:FHA domain-containing protein [Chloroflexota bacterium]